MPTVKEQNAAFDVINTKLHNLLGEIPSIPFIDIRGKVQTFLDSPDGRKRVLEIVHDGLVAAEKVR